MRTNGTATTKEDKSKADGRGPFEKLFGFRTSQLSSWDSFVRLANRPIHPASLAVFRFCYGLLMVIDNIDERGLGRAIDRWGDPGQCHFPLIHGLKPLPVHWMIVLHTIMAIGATGIMLGFLFKQSCLLFAIPYWYIFILDKMRWNNHSYLFGLISLIMLLSDANHCWSLDGLIWPKKRHTHVPLWNLAIPRLQLYILYFYAGLKKFDSDWTHGYSMKLAHKAVFAPLRLFFSKAAINMFVVHTCGHLLDLFLVYLLFFDKTRPAGLVFGLMFNIMNSTMFSIGMFPYMCIVTLPLFCYPDWPMWFFRRLPKRLQFLSMLDEEPQPSEHCVYTKRDIDRVKSQEATQKEDKKVKITTKNMKSKVSTYHKVVTIIALCYASEQLFLPYSHFITQGYNGWTQGLYGYSWDMMIHTWNVQFIKIKYYQPSTNETGFIASDAFIGSKNRWSSNADMIKQHAYCIEERLAEMNLTGVEIYMDVWKSMNNRFQQRVIDPRVNILTADWHPFKKTPWLMPLLLDLSDWRKTFTEIQNRTHETTNFTTVVFAADFPGLKLENYLQTDISSANISVLVGEITVEEFPANKSSYNTTVKEGDTFTLTVGQYHTIHTTSPTPSCYYYIYQDGVDTALDKNTTIILDRMKSEQGVTKNEELEVTITPEDDNITRYLKEWFQKKKQRKARPWYTPLTMFVWHKYHMFKGMYNSLMFATLVFMGEDPADLTYIMSHKVPDSKRRQPVPLNASDDPGNPDGANDPDASDDHDADHDADQDPHDQNPDDSTQPNDEPELRDGEAYVNPRSREVDRIMEMDEDKSELAYDI